MRLWKTKPKAEPPVIKAYGCLEDILPILRNIPVTDPSKKGDSHYGVRVEDSRGFDYLIFKVPRGATMPNTQKVDEYES